MDMFEQASRLKLRFASIKGALSTEQLWDLPLTSKDGFNLDQVARAANNELNEASQESFVLTRASPAKNLAQTRLEIVKHIIAVRLAENEAKTNEASRRAERDRLRAILDQKKDAELQGMSREELEKRIAELS